MADMGQVISVSYDPSVSGLPGNVGDIVEVAGGAAAWQKFGPSVTDWRPFPNAASAPVGAAALGDASVTVNPGTDAASEYVLPAATLTANRTLTLGTTGSPPTNLVVQVIRRDKTNKTFAIINGGAGAGTMLTFAASPTTAQGASFYFDGTNWNFLNFFYVAA